jgi:GxxExxY protein
MEVKDSEYKYSDLTHRIIGCAMAVHSYLGNGFQEVIYQQVLAYELDLMRLNFFQREIEAEIFYKEMINPIGIRRADFIVENKVPVELKALSEINETHWAQTLNYLRAYRIEIGLLINFGEKSLNFKRFVLSPNPKLFKS